MYRCTLCKGVSCQGVPLYRLTIYRPALLGQKRGQIDRELPVCKGCRKELDDGAEPRTLLRPMPVKTPKLKLRVIRRRGTKVFFSPPMVPVEVKQKPKAVQLKGDVALQESITSNGVRS